MPETTKPVCARPAIKRVKTKQMVVRSININGFIGSLRDGASVISVGHHAGVGGVAAQRRGGVACIVGAHVGGTLLPLVGERAVVTAGVGRQGRGLPCADANR